MIEDEELLNEVAELRDAMATIISLYENGTASAWDLYGVACEVTGQSKIHMGTHEPMIIKRELVSYFRKEKP